MSLNRVVFLGAASPHHKRLADVIDYYRGQGNRFDEWRGWLDDTKAGEFCGLPIFGGMDLIPEMVSEGYKFVNTISGSTVGRYVTSKKVIEAGGEFVDFIHPFAEPFKHGISTYVQEEVGIQADVEVGQNCAIHARAFISHECRIGNSCFVGAGTLAGRVTMEDGSYLGINATVLPDLTIGRWSIVGAGAVVTKDVPPYSIVVGNPAKVIREAPVYNAATGELLVSGALT